MSINKWTDESEEFSAEREQELIALQEAYRIASLDRTRYTEEMAYTLKKLSDEVEALEGERIELKKTITVADSPANLEMDEKNCENLTTLLENKDWLEKLIEDEKSGQIELDGKIREKERQTRTWLLSLGGSNFSEKTAKLFKTRQQLDARLQNSLKSYSETLAANQNLRTEIDVLRTQRTRYDQIYKRLDSELNRIKTQSRKLIHDSTQAFEQREEARSKMIQMKEKADKETSQHYSEMKEMVRIIDHDRKLREFMTRKSQDRPEDPQLIAHKERMAKDAETREEAERYRLEMTEMAFQRMKQLMHEDDLEKLVDTFIKNEDRNFALFNYINSKHLEIEVLQEEVQTLKENISTFHLMKAEVEAAREVEMGHLDEQRQKIAAEADKNQTSLSLIFKTMDQLTSQVTSIFKKIGCDSTILERQLCYSYGVTQENIDVYLGLIEMRANELLLTYNFIANFIDTKNLDARTVLLGYGLKPFQQTQLNFNTPNINEDFESDEDDHLNKNIMPLTRDEVLQRIMPLVNKKETQSLAQQYKD